MLNENLLLNIFLLLVGIFIGLTINIVELEQLKIEEEKFSKKIAIKNKEIFLKPKQTVLKSDLIFSKKTDQIKKINFFMNFKTLLSTHNYEKALFLYSNKTHNDNIEKYQIALFDFIAKEIASNNLKIEKLINLFLKVDYENQKALYYLSQVMFQQKKYKKSITLLYVIQESYVEEIFNNKINKKLNIYVSYYLKLLSEQNQIAQKLEFLLFIFEKEPQNVEYKYLLGLFYFEMKDYSNAKWLFEEISSNELYQGKVYEYLSVIKKRIKIKDKFAKEIILEKINDHFYITAVLNDSIKVKLLIDTGATITMLNSDSVKGMELKDSKSISINTANGLLEAKKGIIDNFSIEDLSFENYEVSIAPLSGSFDGLLGMNYLKNFDFYIDQDEAILYLNPH